MDFLHTDAILAYSQFHSLYYNEHNDVATVSGAEMLMRWLVKVYVTASL